jgi:transposase
MVMTKNRINSAIKSLNIKNKSEKVPNPEVSVPRPRRKFGVAFKIRILEEADKCSKPGEIGALLRREGLYSSYLDTWRTQRKVGILNSLTPMKKGPKRQGINPLQNKVALLEKEKAALEKRLAQAQTIIDVQKKVSEILGISLELANQNGHS